MAKRKRPLPTLWEVPDELWERIEPLLKRLDPPARMGRHREDRRRVLDGITPHLRWVQVSFTCARAANGTISRACMATTARSTAAFSIGVKSGCSRSCGHAWCASVKSSKVYSGNGRRPIACWARPGLGGRCWPQSHRSREKWLEKEPGDRWGRWTAGHRGRGGECE